MEIHNHGNNLKVHFPVNSGADNVDSAQTSNEKSGVAKPTATNTSQLTEQIKSGEALRKQLLVEIQAKVHAGEYQTRAAAEEAAARIVGL